MLLLHMFPIRMFSRADRLCLVFWIILTQPWVLGQVSSTPGKKLFSPDSRARITASAVDPSGNVYITGYTLDDVVPTTPDAFQPVFQSSHCPNNLGICSHSFVVKLSADGSQVLYGTYIDGGGDDYAFAITVDPSGNAYVGGTTTSTDFPASGSGFQQTPGAGFIAQLSADGSSLRATYVSARPWRIACDTSGDVYVAGGDAGDAFITTSGAFQTSPQGGGDAFVLKLDASLHSSRYSTRLGGGMADIAYALTVGADGTVYVGGWTASMSSLAGDRRFPVTSGTVSDPPNSSGFLARLSSDGTTLIFSTVLGGRTLATVYDIAVDSSGAIYLTGTTGDGTSFSPGAFMTQGAGFAAKLNADASELLYTTGLPGRGDLFVPFRRMLIQGDQLLALGEGTTPVPTTPDSLSPCTDKLDRPFLIELNANGTERVYGTYVRDLIAVDATYVWSVSQDPNKLLDRQPIRGYGVPAINCVANSGSSLSGPVAPGELISLFGPGIGPDDPVSLQLDASGKVGTSLGGMSVYFNGVAAPLIYVSKNQINAVVPFELAGALNASLTVTKNSAALPQISTPVVAAVPAVFQLPGGSYTIVNQDGTLNTPSNRAPRDSIITVYLTGAGLMKPSSATGSLGNGTTSPVLRATVFLSAANTTPHSPSYQLDLLYVGDAPTLVQGVVALNIRLRDGNLSFSEFAPDNLQICFSDTQIPCPFATNALIWMK